MKLPQSLGKFRFQRKTKNFFVYDKEGVGIAHIAKGTFPGNTPPDEVEVFVRWDQAQGAK